MNELIDHLNREKVIHLYRGKYNNVLRSLYIFLRRAIKDKSTSIEIHDDRIVRKVNDNIIDEISLATIPNGGQIHIENMLLMLEKDVIVNKYVTASLDEDTLVCLINW